MSPPSYTGLGTTNLQVNLNQQRTIIDWSTYNIGSGETTSYMFGANHNNWIVLNRVNSGSATINGTLQGCLADCSHFGGNIWIYASDGVVIGNGAVVNTGGFLATTAPLSMTDSAFATGTGNSFSFGAANAGTSVQVQGNASITSSGGTLAFIAPQVSTSSGSTITAANGTGSVLYGAATSYTLQFAPDANNDFDLVTFDVPAAGTTGGSTSTTPINIQGATKAGNVYVAAVTQSSVANAMISIGGTQTATQASSVGGDIILSAGGGISNGAAAAPSSGTSGTVNTTATGTLAADTQVSLNSTGVINADAATVTGSTTNASTTLNGSSAGGVDVSNASNKISTVSGFTVTVDGDLNITSSTAMSVTGAIGSAAGALRLSDSAGIAFNGGSASTTDDQTYYGPVTLGADTTLKSSSGLVDFGSTLDGSHALTITGNAEFDGFVGRNTKLSSLTVSGTTALYGGSVATTGNQTYSGSVTLDANTTLTSTSGLVDFASKLDGGYTLGITGNAEFDAAVGGTTKLSSLSVSGTSALDGGAISTTGAQT